MCYCLTESGSQFKSTGGPLDPASEVHDRIPSLYFTFSLQHLNHHLNHPKNVSFLFFLFSLYTVDAIHV
ncbi:hypothetical protein GDO81_008423 [Engystomops pustulosus]|uniref:Uncharacterized protein n=1 Tax=Engystomops pustulosus TaxID=76066 RepID=A0AAV7CES8_ENGPU|nr:hypothetical protein GDO81_008423 [Engystomops pustulosus]